MTDRIREVLEELLRKAPNSLEEDLGYVNESILAIKQIVMESLPEQRYYNNPANTLSQYAMGWNACLAELKEKLR